MQMSIFSSEEPLAKVSRWRDFAAGLLTREETSRSPILGLLIGIAPNGWYGRTSPASCRREADGILVPSSAAWPNSGMGSPTEFLTLSSSEWTDLDGLSLSDEGVCSLSEILEVGDVPPQYYLSPKACRGILRRAEKRGKDLPPMLHRALSAVAEVSPEPEKPEARIRSSRKSAAL